MELKSKMIKISTRLTFDIYHKFYMFSLYRGRFYKHGPKIFAIITMVGVGALLFSGFAFGFDMVDITLLIILASLSIFMSFHIFISPKLYYKSRGKFREVDIEYCFEEEYLTIKSSSEVASDSCKIMYKALYKVYEIDEFFFLNLNIRQAYIIPKKDCAYMDIQEIREILENQVDKYINYSRVK